MPFKHHTSRRHRIPKMRRRVINWPAYEAGLRRRGDLTFWLDKAGLSGWRAPRRTTRGGQALHTDMAVELVLTLRLVFHLALRQAEGSACSVLRLLGLDLSVPDPTTLSRRARAFAGRQPRRTARRARSCRAGQHRPPALWAGRVGRREVWPHARQWRKLHLAVDAQTGEILAHLLTDANVGDIGAVPRLLATVEGPLGSVIADGAYDGASVYKAASIRQHDPTPDIVIPPRASSTPDKINADIPTVRDRHVRHIAEQGRMAWQKATGYGRRSLVETAIGRYKHTIAPKLRAR